MAELLIVDTDKRSRKDVRDIVENSDYNYLKIYESSTVERAMMLLRQNPPNALIIDASLPDMDGIAFGKTALQLYPDMPVIVITQLKMFEIAQAAINEGFSAYLLKPLSKFELLSTFERVLKPGLKKEVNQAITHQGTNFDSDLRKPIQSAVQYIQLYYNESITLKGLADKVYLSPSYFSKLFKEEMGMTFVEYLSWIRVQKSKSMLRMSSLPIDVIANNTGFANSSYFATTFKKVEGKTPTQYRELFFWEQTKKNKKLL
ncbi:response regulator transcription factor [Halalkalibacterium ligniniphilum]|uniref:response regulator transcription factor n=1 Tax=Halalkalibacterium ligniniphilum TaxID=1134413 RepID=UPI00034635F7|nr:helix-turn-helix domain-containing protein [Halalkalibacterium ligniniphilum]